MQIICDVDLELDGYKVCKEFQLFYSDVQCYLWKDIHVESYHVAMQDLADKIVKAEGLPEDEREKIEVTNLFLINYTL